MRVLVTGAGGFVGTHLVRLLAASGHEVHGVRLGSDRVAEDGVARVTMHVGDVRDPERVRRLVAEVRPDWVAHLAALSFVPAGEADPLQAYRVNVEGTVGLLAAVRAEARGARLVFVGSSDAYGAVRSDEIPIEEHVPLRPCSVYGATKAAAELAVAQWGRAYGVDVVVARPFNHTGPGQAADFVVPAFARQIARIEAGRQEPVLRVGNLDAVRDLADVRDVVRAYVALFERGRGGETYNVCAGVGVAIGDVLERLLAQSSVPIRVESDPARERRADVPRLIGSHARITRDTGWTPTIPVEQTLEAVLRDWRARLD